MSARGRIFLLDDDDLIVSMLDRALTREGYQVQAETDPAGVLDKIRAFVPDAVLLDIKLPGANGIDLLQEILAGGFARRVIMLTSDDSAETAVRAMKLGAVDYLTKPFNLDEVKITLAHVLETEALQREVDYLRRISSELVERPFIGCSPAIEELKLQATKLAQADVPVILIHGESGTGKEVLARYIHRLRHGDRSVRVPFIGINCAALPEPLIESELFGHEAGSFTDAKSDKQGVFEMAHGGSILLDEIGEMQALLQTKLLRVLEEKVIRRVGGRHEIKVNAAIFATTNRDLEVAVAQGEFRQDLYYRVIAFALEIPPLRDRKEDIPLLTDFFLEQITGAYKRRKRPEFTPEALEHLRAYRWPGNIRELRNMIERIVVLESGEKIGPDDLPREILDRDATDAQGEPVGISIPKEGLSLERVERDLIVQALSMADGNRAKAARLLDVTYDSLRYQIKKFGLD
jgi:DNA-binding NtrC family response regulator